MQKPNLTANQSCRITGFGRKSARKGEGYLHSQRAHVVASDQSVVASDPTGRKVIVGAKPKKRAIGREYLHSNKLPFCFQSNVVASEPTGRESCRRSGVEQPRNGRRSTRKEESYPRSDRAPVVGSDRNVLTSDPTARECRRRSQVEQPRNGRRSVRKVELPHSKRAPMLLPIKNVATSDPTGRKVVEGAESKQRRRSTRGEEFCEQEANASIPQSFKDAELRSCQA
ncbi:hypothetical protein M5K25_022075 [Dendrobium thyrsiflorum]|uniref:Uncharacterized protein n=1 Tax=Dendrobium thyrsiflorum TaxID=117978 RepID=A0ABD0U614_DENTH